MGKEFKFGQMELSIKDFGKIIKRMDKVSFGMFMAISTKETGRETKLMDMVNTLIVTEPPTRVTGETIFNMAEA